MHTASSTQKVPINWRGGFHRVFVILWVAWVGFLFVGLPLKQIHSAQEFAVSMYAYGLDNLPTTAAEKVKRKAEDEERWARASWSYVYKMEVMPNIWQYILAALLVPVAVYAFVRGIVALSQWLFRGFVRP